MPPVLTLAAALSLVVAVALSYPTKDDEALYYNSLRDLPEDYRVDPRNLDGIGTRGDSHRTLDKAGDDLSAGGGNLLRDLSRLRDRAALMRRTDPRLTIFDGSVMGGAKRAPCCNSLNGVGIGNEKRNMDEIDRSSFNSFIKKNFDEIDRSGFGGFVKRNFDEIDRSGFGGFVKKSAPSDQIQN